MGQMTKDFALDAWQGQNFSLLHSKQAILEPMESFTHWSLVGYFHGEKAGGMWAHLHILFRLQMHGVQFHSPIHVHDVAEHWPGKVPVRPPLCTKKGILFCYCVHTLIEGGLYNATNFSVWRCSRCPPTKQRHFLLQMCVRKAIWLREQ